MDLDFDEKCPECGAKIKMTLSDVAKGKTVRCARGHSVRLVDDGGGARKTQREMDKLEKSLKDLGGTIEFKL